MIGGFNLMWDFTEGLSKEQFIQKRKIETRTDMIVLPNGRILMPSLGIY
jgi:hypothetical protein